MIVSIMQPAYLPWLGYFERIAASDVHVVLNHVQFEKNSFINRNRIKTRSGPVWLTIPVQTAGRFGNLPITDVRIDNAMKWSHKHWETLRQSYSGSAFFRDHSKFLKEFYSMEHELLNDVCNAVTAYLLEILSIKTRLISSSTMQLSSAKSDLVLEICRQLGATTYISGELGSNYLDEGAFAEAGITVKFQNYQHPEYRQLHGEFVSHLSVIDLLCNVGPESLEILMTDTAHHARNNM